MTPKHWERNEERLLRSHWLERLKERLKERRERRLRKVARREYVWRKLRND